MPEFLFALRMRGYLNVEFALRYICNFIGRFVNLPFSQLSLVAMLMALVVGCGECENEKLKTK